jgi:hypothetical protein
VNILHDIGICFISLVYVYYLIFVQRLKHDSAWLGKLFLPVQRHCLLSQQLQLRRENVGLRFHGRIVRSGLRAPLVLDVTDESPRSL